jgi:diguanylate cyclase (GGDEF)-like protein
LEAEAGALWVTDATGAVSDEEREADQGSLAIDKIEREQAPGTGLQWRLIASQGFDSTEQRAELWSWKEKLERDDKLFAAPAESSDKARPPVPISADSSSIMVPVPWKGKTGAVIVVKNKNRKLTAADSILLGDIALIAGPALQNAMLYQMAAERAEFDGLTKLYNHRALQERIVQEGARVERARQTGVDRTVALAMMDITDFKLFNDTYGHAVGDAVLRAVSDCLRHTFRVSDVVARFGGDEFVVMLPDTQYHGAETICARAVEAVGSRQLHAPDGSLITIRLTCGVAVFPDDGQNAADLLKVADTRLYVAKRQGELIINSGAAEAAADEITTRPVWSSIGLLEALVTAIDNKDRYTRLHSEEVWKFALLTAHEMDLSSDILQAASIASLVMDVGKIVIPDTILRKPGRLSEEEMQLMQQHPLFGTMVVKDVPHLEMVLGGVRHHHERFDGAGYPDGLSGERIPLLGRLLAVADGYAAMTAERPYRKALTKEEALAEIEGGRGRQYDPAIAAAFVTMMRRTEEDHSALQEALRTNNVGASQRCVAETAYRPLSQVPRATVNMRERSRDPGSALAY